MKPFLSTASTAHPIAVFPCKPDIEYTIWHDPKPGVVEYISVLKGVLHQHHRHILNCPDHYIQAITERGTPIPIIGVLHFKDGFNSLSGDRYTLLRLTSMYKFIDQIHMQNFCFQVSEVFRTLLLYLNIQAIECE